MKSAVIIPARYGSTRFPGKPLAPILGVSMIRRVWTLATAAPGVDAVYVATDDERIADHVEAFGGTAIMTSAECRDGTERTLEAVELLRKRPDIVINLQGDAVLTPPWVIGAVTEALREDRSAGIATPATRFDRATLERFAALKKGGAVGGTTVTFDHAGDALYFSKSIIPYVRGNADPPPVYRHIGLYAYHFWTLLRLRELPRGPFEEAEQLEQLRALENGIPIRVVLVDYQGRTHWAVDSPADVEAAEAIILSEGELVPLEA